MGRYIGQEPLGQVITGEEIPDGLITPEKMATGFFQRKNAIINGDFNIWQRGSSFPAVANGVYTVDRWVVSYGGTMVQTIQRSTDVPTVAQAGRLFNYSLHLDCTTADSSIGSSDFLILAQYIEGYNFLPLAQRALMLSFWVKATKTGTYCVALANSGNDRTCLVEYTVNAANTWEKKTISIPASPSAGTWDYTNGKGLRVLFTLASGSNFHDTAGTWNTTLADKFSTPNQVNACDSTSNDFRITGVQLEAGEHATDFEYRHYQEEFYLCQRYYEKSIHYWIWSGRVTTATIGRVQVNFVSPKRATPTITATEVAPSVGFPTGNPNVGTPDAGGVEIYKQANTTIDDAFHAFHWTASAEL